MKPYGKLVSLLVLVSLLAGYRFYTFILANSKWDWLSSSSNIISRNSLRNLQKLPENISGNLQAFDNSSEVNSFTGGNAQKNIIFIRTSTEQLEHFELCAFYAAANHNPESQVEVLSFRKFELPEYLNKLGNIRSKSINFSSIFEKTPLATWYESKVWHVPALVRRVRYLCDAARASYLYKYGGTYLDTDIICLKNLKSLSNALAHQSPHELNGAFLTMEKGHPFLNITMDIEAKTFVRGASEINYGPKLLTRGMLTYHVV